MKKNCITYFVVFCLLSVVLSGCASSGEEVASENSSKSAIENAKITVAAAANLKSAFTEMATSFEKKTGNTVELSFGASGTLVQQIENGAPFDVFASANVKFVEDLKAKEKVMADTQKLYAKGRVGMVTSKESAVIVKNIEDLLKPEVKKIALANPEVAPYGAAAKEVLVNAGVWEELEGKIVYGKTIEDALTLVTSGNAEVGFSAQAMVKEDEVSFTLLDETLHSPLNQAIAVISETKQEQLAREFVDFVTSSEGKEIMGKYKFEIPDNGGT